MNGLQGKQQLVRHNLYLNKKKDGVASSAAEGPDQSSGGASIGQVPPVNSHQLGGNAGNPGMIALSMMQQKSDQSVSSVAL